MFLAILVAIMLFLSARDSLAQGNTPSCQTSLSVTQALIRELRFQRDGFEAGAMTILVERDTLKAEVAALKLLVTRREQRLKMLDPSFKSDE